MNESFYNTITNSSEWEAWCQEQRRRFKSVEKVFDNKKVEFSFIHKVFQYLEENCMNKDTKENLKVFDVDESQECDLLSQRHWESFIKFLTKTKL